MWTFKHDIEMKAEVANAAVEHYFEQTKRRGCNYVYQMMRIMYQIYTTERDKKYKDLDMRMRANETRVSRQWIPMWSNDPWDDDAMCFLETVTASFKSYVETIGASDDKWIDIPEDIKKYIKAVVELKPSRRVTLSMYIAAAEVFAHQKHYTEASRIFLERIAAFNKKPREIVPLPELIAPREFDIFTNYLDFPVELHCKERLRNSKIMREFSHVRKVLLYIDLSKYNRPDDGRDKVEPAAAWTLLREIMNSVAQGQQLRREIIGWKNCGAEVYIRIRPAPLLEICWNTTYGSPIKRGESPIHVFYRTALYNVINYRVPRAYIDVNDEEITTEFLSQFQRRYVFSNETKSWSNFVADDDNQPPVSETFTMCAKEAPSAFSGRLPTDFAVYADEVMKFLREEESEPLVVSGVGGNVTRAQKSERCRLDGAKLTEAMTVLRNSSDRIRLLALSVNCSDAALYTAIGILQRYLMTREIQIGDIEDNFTSPTAIACLLSAIKFEDIPSDDPLPLIERLRNALYGIFKSVFTDQILIVKENIILESEIIKYNVFFPTIWHFIRHFQTAVTPDEKSGCLAAYYAELASFDFKIGWEFVPSLIAASAAFLAMLVFASTSTKDWDASIAKRMWYTFKELAKCANRIVAIVQAEERKVDSEKSIVTKKYMSQEAPLLGRTVINESKGSFAEIPVESFAEEKVGEPVTVS